MHPTEALTTMSFANFLRQTDAVGLFVFGLLVFMSIVSWYFIVIKVARHADRDRATSSRRSEDRSHGQWLLIAAGLGAVLKIALDAESRCSTTTS
jgi:hypothetical protein